jgi:hypothetical protein
MYALLAVAVVIILRPLLGFLAFALMAWSFFPLTQLNDSRQEAYLKLTPRLEEAIVPYQNAHDFYFFGLMFPPPEFFRTEPPLRLSVAFGFYTFVLQGMMEWAPDSGQPTTTVRPGKEALEHWLLDTIAADLEKKKPELIVMEKSWRTDISDDQSFDFMKWFKKDPRIMRFFKNYTLRKDVELCADPDKPHMVSRCNYRILTRNGVFP